MHATADSLFAQLWQNYIEVTPSAHKIHQLLGQTNGADVINDHIALRTFNLEPVALDTLAKHFEHVGYKACGDYNFEAKKLKAKHFEHSDPNMPKVFISELLVEELSDNAQTIIRKLVTQVNKDAVTADNFLYSGTHWELSHQDYLTLVEESEYAGWTAAWGYRANHFTVSVNHLTQFEKLEDVNTALKDAEFKLNSVGGEIKGSAEVLLEQSSTMADKAECHFSNGTHVIPSCFYEFALRYAKADGQLYTGFVAASADKIFESTNAAG